MQFRSQLPRRASIFPALSAIQVWTEKDLDDLLRGMFLDGTRWSLCQQFEVESVQLSELLSIRTALSNEYHVSKSIQQHTHFLRRLYASYTRCILYLDKTKVPPPLSGCFNPPTTT